VGTEYVPGVGYCSAREKSELTVPMIPADLFSVAVIRGLSTGLPATLPITRSVQAATFRQPSSEISSAVPVPVSLKSVTAATAPTARTTIVPASNASKVNLRIRLTPPDRAPGSPLAPKAATLL
jgi:hypothetical protein